MAKSTGKSKEIVILIRIPDAEARKGEASLTIQRGELGHLHQFNYTGLTLRGNITEAVQTALVALAKLEAAPPKFNTTETPAQAESAVTTTASADENESNADEAADTDDGEAVEEREDDTNDDDTPTVVHHMIAPASESTERTISASQSIEDAVPVNTAQMSLF